MAPNPDPGSQGIVKRTLVVVLLLNLLVTGAKLGVGWLIGSLAMIADGFHSLTDSASNVVGLVGISVASRPPDANHPYGHGKFETLSALFIGGLLAVTALEILQGCIERIGGGPIPEVTPVALAVLGAVVVIDVAVSTWENRKGEELDSEILTADAAHTRSDVYTSLGVLASLVAVRLGYPILDVVAALVITGIIGHAAFRILRESAARLADPAHVPAEEVRELALGVPGVLGAHKIRTRLGPSGPQADLHVQVKADLRLDQAHVIGHMVSDLLERELGLRDVVAHVEPPVGHETEWLPPEEPRRNGGRDEG